MILEIITKYLKIPLNVCILHYITLNFLFYSQEKKKKSPSIEKNKEIKEVQSFLLILQCL